MALILDRQQKKSIFSASDYTVSSVAESRSERYHVNLLKVIVSDGTKQEHAAVFSQFQHVSTSFVPPIEGEFIPNQWSGTTHWKGTRS
ncbi:MAG: hypothetical protein Tsb009_06480 [Planctomycetaceae bacterium]